MFEAAYYCEIMRAGIQSIARGQVAAGYALGLNYWQTMGYIVLPQAFRNMLPVLLTQTIILFQDTSLVYVISVTDFLGAAAKVANRDYRLVEMYTLRRGGVLHHLVLAVAARQAPPGSDRGHPMISNEERQQVVRQLPGAQGLHDEGVDKGEVVVVCGPSGTGKSTLIKCVNGLEPFQKGEIIVDGISVGDPKTNLPKLRSRIGMVFQHFELFPHMTVTRT